MQNTYTVNMQSDARYLRASLKVNNKSESKKAGVVNKRYYVRSYIQKKRLPDNSTKRSYTRPCDTHNKEALVHL